MSRRRFFAGLIALPLCGAAGLARTDSAPPAPYPHALIVVAHPDDESCFSATVYEITHNLGGAVDELVVTNGEGGYRYSLLAESYYHAPLTDEKTGRELLPEIRRKEALEAGRILGVSNHFFLGERDVRYTQDVDEVLHQHWNESAVRAGIKNRLEAGKYDFVLTLFPTLDAHGAHKAAALTALAAVEDMPGGKPLVLACQDASSKSATPLDWTGFQNPKHPFTVALRRYAVDRTVRFGFNGVMDYSIVANWVIAAHKSQGAFQMDAGRFDREEFAILGPAPVSDTDKTDKLFTSLSETAAHPPGVSATDPPQRK
ncbi:MAG: PIG-L family deacetylase [Elusimicrobiota bacterium]